MGNLRLEPGTQISPDVWGTSYFATAGSLHLPELHQPLCIRFGISEIISTAGFHVFSLGI